MKKVLLALSAATLLYACSKSDTGDDAGAGTTDSGTSTTDGGGPDGGAADAGDPSGQIEAATSGLSESGSLDAANAINDAISEILGREDPGGDDFDLGGLCPRVRPAGARTVLLSYGLDGRGCKSTRTGAWLTGTVEVVRNRRTPYEVTFTEHRRGLRRSNPTLDGKIEVERNGAVFVVRNHASPLSATIGQGPGATAYTVKMDGTKPPTYTVSAAQVSLTGKLELDSAQDDYAVRIAEAAPLVFPMPPPETCQCPASGLLELAGELVAGEPGTVTIDYGPANACGVALITYLPDGAVAPLTLYAAAGDHSGEATDRVALLSICLQDGVRAYSCPRPGADGDACKDRAGVYRMAPGGARYRILNPDAAGAASGMCIEQDQGRAGIDVLVAENMCLYDYSRHHAPNQVAGIVQAGLLDACAMAVGGREDQLQKVAMTVHVFENCAATITAQVPDRDPISVCGRIELSGNDEWSFGNPRTSMTDLASAFLGRNLDSGGDIVQGAFEPDGSMVIEYRRRVGGASKVGDVSTDCLTQAWQDAHAKNGCRMRAKLAQLLDPAGQPTVAAADLQAAIEAAFPPMDECPERDSLIARLLTMRVRGGDGNPKAIGDVIRDQEVTQDILEQINYLADAADHEFPDELLAGIPGADDFVQYEFPAELCPNCDPPVDPDEGIWPIDGQPLLDALSNQEILPADSSQWFFAVGRMKMIPPKLEDLHEECLEVAANLGEGNAGCFVDNDQPDCDSHRYDNVDCQANADNEELCRACQFLCQVCGQLTDQEIGGLSTVAELPNYVQQLGDFSLASLPAALSRLQAGFSVGHLENGNQVCEIAEWDPEPVWYDFVRAYHVVRTPNASLADYEVRARWGNQDKVLPRLDLDLAEYCNKRGGTTGNTPQHCLPLDGIRPGPCDLPVTGPFANVSVCPGQQVDCSLMQQLLDSLPDNISVKAYGLTSVHSTGDNFHPEDVLRNVDQQFEYAPGEYYAFHVKEPGNDGADVFDPDARVRVHAPDEINLCRPRGIILDNLYFPNIVWDGRYESSTTADLAFLGSLFLPETAQHIGPYKYGLGTVLGWMDAVEQQTDDPEPLSLAFWLATHDASEALGALGAYGDYSLMAWPDIGYMTMPYLGWHTIAPTGRGYMGTPIEIVDYVFNVTAARWDFASFDAAYTHGRAIPPEDKHNGARAVAVDVEIKPIIVLNSDRFPGGNYTHFFRRDLLGMGVEANGGCPQP